MPKLDKTLPSNIQSKDQGHAVPLTDIATVNIIVAPAVENLQAQPEGNTVLLSWDANM